MTAPAFSRPDLSERTGLSKSAFSTFEWCQQQAWWEKHDRRPFIPSPNTTFGSAVDAGVETIAKYLRIGQEPQEGHAWEAAEEARARNGVEIDMAEVHAALDAFLPQVAGHFDWSYVRLQEHLHVTVEGIGEVDGHPDIILPGEPWDVKTSTRAKETARTVELGTYGLMVEEDTGKPVARVGYICWVRRLRTPGWQLISAVFDDDFREWTRQRWGGFVRANNTDDMLNRKRAEMDLPPENYSFPGGPISGKRCRTCAYAPAFGGGCRMAVTEQLPGGSDD